MALSPALTDSHAQLVADTSTVINLIATAYAPTILAALPHHVVVADVIPAELERGRSRGYPHADRLRELLDAGVISVVCLGNIAMKHFEELVIGPAVATLDDGEAATLAYAAEHAAVAVIDERKAARISTERFPALRITSTVDVLTHPNVERRLGREALAEAVYQALQVGRMRVPAQHLEYVVRLIGSARAAVCASLPKSARSSA
jgi:predicted nucleic acid-binding protein